MNIDVYMFVREEIEENVEGYVCRRQWRLSMFVLGMSCQKVSEYVEKYGGLKHARKKKIF